jgi:hypothetical protein
MPCTATYETICQSSGQSGQLALDAVRTKGKVQFTIPRCHIVSGCNLHDVAPMAVVFGAQKYGVAWSPPNGLSFISAEVGQHFEMPRTMQLAPTAVSDESRIDFQDSRLQWFSLSQTKDALAIPIHDLPR